MSIVRDIPTTSQHSAEPNLAITAGFGSVALSAPTNLGGLDGSICSTQHREESAQVTFTYQLTRVSKLSLVAS